MMRVARVDANQAEIVDALRAAGCAVYVASHVGAGFPDLIVSRRQRGEARPRLFMIEVKDSARPPSERRLTPAQKEFHALFAGNCYIAHSVADAFAIVGIGPRLAA